MPAQPIEHRLHQLYFMLAHRINAALHQVRHTLRQPRNSNRVVTARFVPLRHRRRRIIKLADAARATLARRRQPGLKPRPNIQPARALRPQKPLVPRKRNHVRPARPRIKTNMPQPLRDIDQRRHTRGSRHRAHRLNRLNRPRHIAHPVHRQQRRVRRERALERR